MTKIRPEASCDYIDVLMIKSFEEKSPSHVVHNYGKYTKASFMVDIACIIINPLGIWH